MKRIKAEITVFLALTFVLIASLVLSSVESVRVQATRCYLSLACDAAMDSLYSQYHRQLWDEYNLLGVEMYSCEEVTGEFYEFLSPYLDKEQTKNWYGLSSEKEDVTLEEFCLMTDENGKEFEKAVRQFMLQGGLLASLPSEEELKKSVDLMQNAFSVQEISGELSVTSEKALELSECYYDLEAAAEEANKKRQAGITALEAGNGASFKHQAKAMEEKLKKIQTLAEKAGSLAKQVQEEYSAKKKQLEEEYAAGRISEESFSLLQTQLEEMKGFCEEKQLQKVSAVAEEAGKNQAVLEKTKDLVEEVEDVIATWDEEESGELDEEALWSDVLSCFQETKELSFSSGLGRPDQKKKQGYKALGKTLSGSLLTLAFPSLPSLSQQKMDLKDCPSGRFLAEKTSLLNGDTLTDRFLVTVYTLRKLSELSPGEEELQKPEIEYVLYGNDTDYENVSCLISRILAFRSAENLITILSDSSMRQEASSIAALILGATPAAGLSQALGFAIMALWALSQAVVDARRIFSGQSVPFRHTAATFDLSLEGLLSGSVKKLLEEAAESPGKTAGNGSSAGSGSNSNGNGSGSNNSSGNSNNSSGSGRELDYETCLRLLLMLSSGSEADYRVMDIIQLNLRQQQPDFLVQRLHTSDKLSVKATSRHSFTGVFSDLNDAYSLTAETSYSY